MAQPVEEQLQNLALEAEGEQQVQQGEQQQQQPEQPELHRVCAGGNLDQVRAVLSQGLEALETVDPTTGCTPIVLAIQANHPDVVRELLSAGAIVPPPGLTGDPLLLSILYPHPMHFAPPPPHFGQPYPQEFYPPQGYYPDPAAPPQFMPPFPQGQERKDAQAANLPPADVAKMIPCRNFPACKYGNSCMFLHPAQPFYPGPPQGFQGFAPQGFYPPQQFAPMEFNGAQQDPTSPHVPSALTPAFVPAFASPPQAPFGVSPMSPTMAAEQLQFIPRRMSQSQGPGPKGFHGKKPSFSGGKGMGPWAARQLGQWKDGVPPPCAFFAQGKCRNAEYCKFPHLDAEGNDCRHPDVIRGVIPPAPSSLARPPRVVRPAGSFDPNFRRTAPNGTEAAAAASAVPAKPTTAAPARAASNPGVARAQSPRRGAARPFAVPSQQRASSAGGNKQRVPSAEEFPALAGSTGSLAASADKRDGKTAAQVLSAPAPSKPVSAAPSAAGDAPESTASESSQGVTMDSDAESDAVVISCKPSAVGTPNTEARLSPEPTSKPMSFASIAGPPVALTA